MSRGTIAALGGGAGGLVYVEHLLTNLPLEFFSTPAGLLLVVVASFLMLLGGVLVLLRVLALPTGRSHPRRDVPRVTQGEPVEPAARRQLSGTVRDVLQLEEGRGDDP